MANNQNLLEDNKATRWKPGESGNPLGKPRKLTTQIIADLKLEKAESVTASTIRDTFEVLLGLTQEELDKLTIDRDNPAIVRLIAGMFAKATKGKEVEILTFMLDRAHGKPSQRNEHTGEDGAPLFPAGAVTVNILGAGAKPITNEDDLPEDDEFFKIDE